MLLQRCSVAQPIVFFFLAPPENLAPERGVRPVGFFTLLFSEDFALVARACRYQLTGGRQILPVAHAAVIPDGYTLPAHALLRYLMRSSLHILLLLLLLQNPCLLFLPGGPLHLLLLLPGHLLLFGTFPFRLLLFPSFSCLSGQQIPDPGRCQVECHQHCQQRQDEYDRRTQYRPEIFPQRPGQNRPDGPATD